MRLARRRLQRRVRPPASANFPLNRSSAIRISRVRIFKPEDLEELTVSIRERGVISPIVVRPMPGGADGEYQIVAGERRWRASQKAGRRTIPGVVRQLDDLEVMEIALIENIQRADLNALEEARGYAAMETRFGRGADAIAKVVGKSRSHVANTMRLMRLPEPVRHHLEAGRLTAGHAPRPPRGRGRRGHRRPHRQAGAERPPDRSPGQTRAGRSLEGCVSEDSGREGRRHAGPGNDLEQRSRHGRGGVRLRRFRRTTAALSDPGTTRRPVRPTVVGGAKAVKRLGGREAP